jgi:adenylosuccinate synthase
MSVWVVVGGQFGSEGKGKVSAYLTLNEQIDICVRCGGPNSGHSFIDTDGNHHLVRQVPTGYIDPFVRLLLPAGGLIDPAVLKREIDLLGLSPHRLGIDRHAMIIEETDKRQEQELNLNSRLSSTLCGVGAAVSRRALRGESVRLAAEAGEEYKWIPQYLTDTSKECNEAHDAGKQILVEGTQGYGLSVYHSSTYPKATSRDTTAAAFLSEVGISPAIVKEIVLVLRTFPIRVAGAQAGPLKDEIDWDILQKESGYPYPLHEITSVTRKTRRIGRFDWELAERAISVNRPTRIVINGLDYLDFRNFHAREEAQLSEHSLKFINRFEEELGPISMLGSGPSIDDFVIRCKSKQLVGSSHSR